MEIKQGKGQFCQRDPNLKSTISKNGNQTGQRPILSEGFQSKIYYFKKWKSDRAKANFAKFITINRDYLAQEISVLKNIFKRAKLKSALS